MRKSIAIAATVIVVGLTYAASAHDHSARAHDDATRVHDQVCRDIQGATQLSSEQFQRKIEELGYTLQRMESEHGCIEARLVEKSTGKSVKALFNASTGELLRARPAS